MGDPARDRNLREHPGINPYNLEHMGKSQEWLRFFREANNLIANVLFRDDSKKLVVFAFCRAGRHRSVAAGHVLSLCLNDSGFTTSLQHLSQPSFWKYTCGGSCETCGLQETKAKDTYDKAMTRFKNQWDMFPHLKAEDSERRVVEEPASSAAPSAPRCGRELSRDERDKKRQAVPSSDLGSRTRSKSQGFEIEEARLIELLAPYEDEDTIREICQEFLTRIYLVFKPSGISHIDGLLLKSQWNYVELIISVARKYLADSHGSATELVEDVIQKIVSPRKVEAKTSSDEVQELKSLVQQLTETVRELKASPFRPPEPAGPPPGHVALSQEIKEEEQATSARSPDGQEEVARSSDDREATVGRNPPSSHTGDDPTVNPDIRRRDLAHYNVDAENPQELPAEFLDRIFEGGKKKNFMLWIPNSSADCPKIRVNAKLDAWNTYVKFPDEFTWHRKSTMVQWNAGDGWELYEDRVKVQSYKAFTYTPRRCLIFLLPPRSNLENDGTGVSEYTAHVAMTVPDIRKAPSNVMSKKERQDYHAGLKREHQKNGVLMNVFGRFAALAGLIFLITPHEFTDSAGIVESETLYIRSPGLDGKFFSDPTWCQNISNEINNLKPDLIVTVHQMSDNYSSLDDRWLLELYRSLSDGQVGVVIDAAVTPRWRSWQGSQIVDERFGEFVVHETRGDLAIGTTCQHLAEPLIAWCNQQSRYHCPKSIETINDPELIDILVDSLEDTKTRLEIDVAFPAEARQDDADILGYLDVIRDPRTDSAQAIPDPDQPHVDAELLDDLPLEGFPVEEAERRKAWSRVPRKARIAIRRLHNMIGHKPKDVMLQILKGAKAEPELIAACKDFKCDACAVSHEGDRTHPVAAPPRFEFNHTVIVDVFETHDDENGRHSWLSIVCSGTCYHQVVHIEQGGQPSSGKCLEKFSQYWASWAGFPKVVTTDRGLHNRGAFSRKGYGTVVSSSVPPDWRAQSISEEVSDMEGSSNGRGVESAASCISMGRRHAR